MSPVLTLKTQLGYAVMPNKYPEKKGWNVPKQKFKVTNWFEYNQSLLHQRGNIWGSISMIN
jgi:hypothetical protein